MDFRSMAEAAMDRRSALFEKRKKIVSDSTLKTDEKRGMLSVLDYEMDSLAAEARQYVEEGERQQEIRGAYSRAGALGETRTPDRGEENSGEWRGLLPSATEIRELRAEVGTDFIVPSGTAAKYVDMLRAKAVFLKGIPAENLMPFTDRDWTLPVLSDSDMPALVAENALITEGDDTWDGLSFTAKKYAAYRTVGNETLADSAFALRRALADAMLRNVAVEFDNDAFNGDGTTTPVLGLVGQGVSTNAAGTAGSGATATFDDVADAIGRLWAANAEPSVIWAAPNAAIALSKERAGSNGDYVADADSAVGLARRLPTLVSNNVPAGKVIVADGSRGFAGRREDARVAVSEHAEFQNDKTALRLTMRCAGVYAAEASSVQVIIPA